MFIGMDFIRGRVKLYMQIKVMTFNIQHGRDFIKRDINLPMMADVIRNQQADIIGLNEVRGKGTHVDYQEQAQIIGEDLGFYYYFGKAIDLPQGPYGNALVSRFPLTEMETIIIPDPEIKDEKVLCYETRCIIKAKIVELNLTVLISHFGLAQSEQRNAIRTLIEELKKIEGPCIFMGDLNMTPEDEKIKQIEGYLTDVSVKLQGNKLSFPSVNPERKIDYIFGNEFIEIVRAEIPEIVASDHFPHTAIVRIKDKK